MNKLNIEIVKGKIVKKTEPKFDINVVTYAFTYD